MITSLPHVMAHEGEIGTKKIIVSMMKLMVLLNLSIDQLPRTSEVCAPSFL